MSLILQTDRLELHTWDLDRDLAVMVELNASEEVMRFFPTTVSVEGTVQFIDRQVAQFDDNGYAYLPVVDRSTAGCVGFIGLSDQSFESPYTPAVDIGWRLHPQCWGQGYATEMAQACLHWGLDVLQLPKIIAICPLVNTPSQRVMQKIGMTFVGTFDHPALTDYPDLLKCVCYSTDGLSRGNC